MENIRLRWTLSFTFASEPVRETAELTEAGTGRKHCLVTHIRIDSRKSVNINVTTLSKPCPEIEPHCSPQGWLQPKPYSYHNLLCSYHGKARNTQRTQSAIAILRHPRPAVTGILGSRLRNVGPLYRSRVQQGIAQNPGQLQAGVTAALDNSKVTVKP